MYYVRYVSLKIDFDETLIKCEYSKYINIYSLIKIDQCAEDK